ncbi:MAG: 6-carboxytetrahydropterin synthase [Bacteroidales bacterium]|nr:6-carboxytetrahydropterin synthase [Bacteroidales bacterium]
MTLIRITKKFDFEMAHALMGYDGLCKNIHGHSYKLFVTVTGQPLQDDKSPKNGMVLDFSLLKDIVKKSIIEKYDHSLVLNSNMPESLIKPLKKNYERIILMQSQPTTENIIIEIAKILKSKLPKNVKLFSIRLYETDSSYAEWYASDN